MPLDEIHLHEVGALDSIIDIVGVVYGMDWLGADRIVASPLNVGSGTVKCAHGIFPVPAPATARLLQGVPVYAGAVAAELVTPTGALIVTEYADAFGRLPMMRVESIGYGAGHKDFPGNPNVLRLLVGDADATATADRVDVLECEIDDMNPQLFGPLMERLHQAGALDVFYASVQMKKNRPGTLVTVDRAARTARGALGSAVCRDDDDRRALSRDAARLPGARSPEHPDTGRPDPIQDRQPCRPRAERVARVRGLRQSRGRARTGDQGRAGDRHQGMARRTPNPEP